MAGGSKSVADFKRLESNVYSQFGEDGIIDWVFGQIEPSHRLCVEFGAWDGQKLSNTFNLVAHHGWNSIYIEADADKYRMLEKTATVFPNITPIHRFVTSAGEKSLDCILEQNDVPKNFDLLSIDVDGTDYDVWEGLTNYTPALVVVEHNPSIPPGTGYIDREGRAFMGSSVTSFAALAERKGYGLLGCTFANSFFLRVDLFNALNVRPQTVDEAFDRQEVCHVFLNYAGELVFSNGAVAERLRSVAYRSWIKTWVRRLLGMPTFYILGQTRAEEGAILRLSRWLASVVRR